jgi:prephenate dehydrogenase
MQIGIIGFGRFGSLAGSVLSGQFKVLAWQYKQTNADKARARMAGVRLVDFKTACGSEVVIFAVPIGKTEAIIKKASKLVKPGALVLDACSVKVLPALWLKKYMPATVEIMATHPMFGPNTSDFDLKKQSWNLKGLQIVLCPLRINTARFKRIVRFLKKLKLEVITATPEEHDRANAESLSLVHFIGRSLYESGARGHKIQTPGYKDLLRLYKHTVSDSWELFYDMHNFNPYAKKIRENFVKSCSKINKKIWTAKKI